MLQSIHKHIQGWVAGLIIAAISVTFALWGIQYYIGGHSGDGKALVKFDDSKITVKQFSNYYRRVVSEQPKFAALTGAAKQILQQQVLTEMIQKQALVDALKKDGFSVSIPQVRSAILKEAWFQEDGQFSKKRFQQLLYANSITEQQYVQQLQSQLMVDQLKQGLQGTAIVMPNELTQSYELLNQSRSFGYFIIPAHLFSHKIKPTSEQLQAYYKHHQAQFMLPEQVSIEYIVLSPMQMAKARGVSEQKIQDEFSQAADQLSNLTYTTPDSLQPAAKALKLKVQTTPLFDHQGSHAGILANKEVVTTAFNPELISSGNNSSPISLADGGMVVLRIKRHVLEHVAPFKQVKTEVIAGVREQLATQHAQKLAEKLKKELASGAKPLDLAKKHKLIWNVKNKVVHSNITVPKSIISAAFYMPYDTNNRAVNLSVVPFKNNDIALIELLGINVPNKANIKTKDRQSLVKTIGMYSGQLDFQLFGRSAVDDSKVKIDQAALKSLI